MTRRRQAGAANAREGARRDCARAFTEHYVRVDCGCRRPTHHRTAKSNEQGEVAMRRIVVTEFLSLDGVMELEHADWSNSTILRGDLMSEVTALKQQDGGDILVAGSATLVRDLLVHGLADEYRLMVFPVVLGSGKQLFAGEGDAAALKLVDVRSLPTGTVILTYHLP
ncbi:MAG TPA: dihydrofolate reductase family protein [Solirubrobacteraceae bacterium]